MTNSPADPDPRGECPRSCLSSILVDPMADALAASAVLGAALARWENALDVLRRQGDTPRVV